MFNNEIMHKEMLGMFRKANMNDLDRISEIYDEIHLKIEKKKW